MFLYQEHPTTILIGISWVLQKFRRQKWNFANVTQITSTPIDFFLCRLITRGAKGHVPCFISSFLSFWFPSYGALLYPPLSIQFRTGSKQHLIINALAVSNRYPPLSFSPLHVYCQLTLNLLPFYFWSNFSVVKMVLTFLTMQKGGTLGIQTEKWR